MAKDRPIGDTFEMDGKKYLVERKDRCAGCAFNFSAQGCGRPDFAALEE